MLMLCCFLTLLFFPSSSAAVDYLAKNVSLSTQRRMKLGEHSAVLGLLPVETGQAYWRVRLCQQPTPATWYHWRKHHQPSRDLPVPGPYSFPIPFHLASTWAVKETGKRGRALQVSSSSQSTLLRGKLGLWPDSSCGQRQWVGYIY